jgi:hypothetical protein
LRARTRPMIPRGRQQALELLAMSGSFGSRGIGLTGQASPHSARRLAYSPK